MKRIKIVVSLLCLLLMLCATIGYAGDSAVADKALAAASEFAKKLDGEWGDRHTALVNSGEKEAFAGFAELQNVLKGFVAENETYYVYTLCPSGAPESASYFVTVDGSKSPDKYGEVYDFEEAHFKAWSGTAAAQEETWEDDDGKKRVSAYAPVHDSAGKVVTILGVDVLVP
jgi:hypothetical protein